MEQTWIEAATIVVLGFTFVFLFLSVLIGCVRILYHLSPTLERFLPVQSRENKQSKPNQSLKAKAIAAALAVHHQRMQSM